MGKTISSLINPALMRVNQELFFDHISLMSVVEEFGSPTYLYSQARIEANIALFQQAFSPIKHQLSYAVKANSNLSILKIIADAKLGFDIVSLGELVRVMKAGGDPKKITFSGVSKTAHEIEAAIQAGIHCFDVESVSELKRIQALALKLKVKVNVALRFNPNIDANTHAYISTGQENNKFGMKLADIISIVEAKEDYPALKIVGVASHIGSQITDIQPLIKNVEELVKLGRWMLSKGVELQHINIGGGMGIRYQDETPLDLRQYAEVIQKTLADLPVTVSLEPGRAIVGDAGVLLTRVEYIKAGETNLFALVDAGMNDLMRPALYDAWHGIYPVSYHHDLEQQYYDIVGPVCESSDFLAKHRLLAIAEGDYLVVDTVGAYGFSMSSNYNTRCRAAEVLINGQGKLQLIRRRELLEDLFAHECG